ncbi:hypothetical protein VFPPC_18727 [Pochonia chlamydosporia 170]|uniref:Uncharacterized protein n=1 Tax=Pochonia chlamydosporia 170 TaxID=1380566 RepID=A0A219AS03_METCM|nr:hypothetical protein VFPPC_18727 [Pochonia chlamydosporia 170]OWT43546.1 hypothetical protein VFPPC_18727 [Pochonia chlamydosporia 170]
MLEPGHRLESRITTVNITLKSLDSLEFAGPTFTKSHTRTALLAPSCRTIPVSLFQSTGRIRTHYTTQRKRCTTARNRVHGSGIIQTQALVSQRSGKSGLFLGERVLGHAHDL